MKRGTTSIHITNKSPLLVKDYPVQQRNSIQQMQPQGVHYFNENIFSNTIPTNYNQHIINYIMTILPSIYNYITLIEILLITNRGDGGKVDNDNNFFNNDD